MIIHRWNHILVGCNVWGVQTYRYLMDRPSFFRRFKGAQAHL